MVPMSIIATTGFLWNHEKSLGIKQEHEQKSRVDAVTGSDSPEGSKAALVAAPGAWTDHSQVIDAALAAASHEWGPNVPLERIELKNEPGLGLVVKVKAPEGSKIRPYEIVWSAAQGNVIEKKGDPKAGTDWAMIVHDLHTGKFFSKQFGFIWSDSSAIAIVALSLTGVVLYLIPVLKKRNKKKRQPSNTPGLPMPRNAPSVVRTAAPPLTAALSDTQG